LKKVRRLGSEFCVGAFGGVGDLPILLVSVWMGNHARYALWHAVFYNNAFLGGSWLAEQTLFYYVGILVGLASLLAEALVSYNMRWSGFVVYITSIRECSAWHFVRKDPVLLRCGFVRFEHQSPRSGRGSLLAKHNWHPSRVIDVHQRVSSLTFSLGDLHPLSDASLDGLLLHC